MKKILLLLFILTATTLSAQVTSSSQIKFPPKGTTKILEKDVPQIVLDSFYKNTKLDKSVVVLWRYNEADKQYYGAFYRDVLKSEAYILADGKYLLIYEDIKLKDIPAKILQYMSDNMPNSTVMTAYTRTQSGGKIYQLKVSEKMGSEATRTYTQTKNYQFDSEANLLRYW